MHVHVRDSHASLESQEVDPMRFPARGTSDEDDPMRIRAQGCVSTSAMWRLLRPSPHTYTYAYTYTYVYSYTHICMYMCATRMHLSNLRKLIRCVFLREAHLTKVIRCGFVRKVVSVRVQCSACCARLHIHIPMPIPTPMSIHIHTYACTCARLACISRISGS